MSQAEVAQQLEVSRNTIANYENDVTTPKRYILREWAAVTGVDFGWLMDGDQDPTPAVHQPADVWLVAA